MYFTYVDKDQNARIKNFLLKQGDALDYEEVERLCSLAFPRIPISTFTFENKPFESGQSRFGGNNFIFRARLINDSSNKPFDGISDISYIQDKDLHLIKDCGRANKRRQSMFYGAFDYQIGCVEVMPSVDQVYKRGSLLFVVGMWKIIDSLRLAQIPHSERMFRNFYDTVSFDSDNIKIDDVRKKNTEIKDQISNDYDFENLMFFADQFARFDEGNSYKLSNYYSSRVLNHYTQFPVQEHIEGIVYPSIVNSYQHENIVLNPNTVDKKLKFHSAMLVLFTPAQVNGEGAKFIPIKENVFPDEKGNLKW